MLLCTLTTLFFRTFVSEILISETSNRSINILVFSLIPIVLFLFFASAIFDFFKAIVLHREGVTFQTQLIIYFIVTIIFVIIPIIIIITLSIGGLSRFWNAGATTSALDNIHEFVLDVYSLHSERFKQIIYSNDLDNIEIIQIDEYIGAIQDFVRRENGDWETLRFAGDGFYRLEKAITGHSGFITRDIPRDIDTIRYAVKVVDDVQRIISYKLGNGFDTVLAVIEQEKSRFEIINTALGNMRSLFLFYSLIFLFPTILLTMLIAISFTRKLTQPLAELASVTQKLAGGDFSLHIITRRNDELGLLISSFNSMVPVYLPTNRTNKLFSEHGL